MVELTGVSAELMRKSHDEGITKGAGGVSFLYNSNVEVEIG
jgi:hypothetical protein